MIETIIAFIQSNGALISVLSAVGGGFLFAGKVIWEIIKKKSKRKELERHSVERFMSLLDKSVWTFYPVDSIKKEEIPVIHELKWLFKSCSIKSATTRCRTHESRFIKGLVTNYAKQTSHLNYQGAVKFDISNRQEILDEMTKSEFPEELLLMKRIFETNFKPHANIMNIDCIDGSLNNVLIDWKKSLLNYDRSLVKKYSWLQWQPNI